MKIRTKLIINFMMVLGLLTTIVLLSSIRAGYSNKIVDAEKNRSEYLMLADALQTTSDDLTKMARLYVTTGQIKYKNYFDEILEIRNGKVARPLDYDKTYWDKRINDEIDLSKTASPISMQELLKNSGLTSNELIELEKAEKLSNELAKIENQAFKLMEENSTQSHNQAKDLLYNVKYYQFKAAIRKPLQNFFVLISNRTTLEINTYRKAEQFYNTLSIGILALTFIFVSYFFIDFKKKILTPIANLTSVAEEVKQGNLQKRGLVINEDELGYLTESFNEMSDLLSKQILELDAQKKIMDKHAIISISNTNGDILYVNDKFTQASGYTKEDLIGKNHRILNSHYHDDSFFKEMWETISSGSLWSGEIRNITKTGDYYWVTATIAPIMGQNHKPNGYISILTDITRQKFIELQLRNAINLAEEATEAKSAFLANMSHEIRTPMNAIIGFSELALTIEDTPAKAHTFIKKVNSSAKHLLTIINDILDFSKIEAGKLDLDIRCFNLFDLITESVDILALQASSKGIDLSFNYPKNLSKCFRGDSSRIRQVIINLVGNAIKFTNEGSVQIEVKGEQDFIHVEIIDTGIGMTENQINKIFNSFSQADVSTQRNFGGTGLGTTISKQLVEMMGGKIWVESEFDVGSHFHFTLKLGDRSCENSCQVKSVILDKEHADDGKYNILLAEDNELNAELILINLQNNLGHQVHWTKDGRECLDAYKENAEKYNLILMDFQMPVMDGIKATKEIRTVEKTTDNHIPIIALTASATDEDKRICFEAGMDDFVMKPINIKELLKKIKAISSGNNGLEKDVEESVVESDSKLKSLSQHFDINKGLKSWMDESSYIKALIRFSNKYTQSTDELIKLIKESRTKEAIRYTHTIKGMSLGLNTLATIANDIENELKKDRLLQALALVPEYDLILKTIVSEIDNLKEEDLVTTHSHIDKMEMLQALLIVLEEDNPDPAEAILVKLKEYLDSNILTNLENTVSNFEFEEAKNIVQNILTTEEASVND